MMNNSNNPGVSNPGQPGIPPGGMQQNQVYAQHIMQYPTYAPMQVLPSSVPGNVFVSNVTANVNVHGMLTHTIPHYVPATYMSQQDMPQIPVSAHDAQVSKFKIKSNFETFH